MKCAVVLKPPGARLYFKRNEKERAKKKWCPSLKDDFNCLVSKTWLTKKKKTSNETSKEKGVVWGISLSCKRKCGRSCISFDARSSVFDVFPIAPPKVGKKCDWRLQRYWLFWPFLVWPSICTHKPPSGFPIRSTLDCVFCCCWKMARVYLSFLFCLAQRQLPKWMAMEVLSINVWAFSPLTNSVRVWIVDKTRRKICVYISDPMSQPSVWLSCNIFIHFYLFIYFKPKKKNCRRG